MRSCVPDVAAAIAECTEKGVRYVVMCLNSFTNQPYCDLPECFAG
ncbi:hypothetical protein [Gemmata sp.]